MCIALYIQQKVPSLYFSLLAYHAVPCLYQTPVDQWCMCKFLLLAIATSKLYKYQAYSQLISFCQLWLYIHQKMSLINSHPWQCSVYSLILQDPSSLALSLLQPQYRSIIRLLVTRSDGVDFLAWMANPQWAEPLVSIRNIEILLIIGTHTQCNLY